MFLQAADFPIDAIRRQIAEGVDVIVHLGREPDGGRVVLEIAEIEDFQDGEICLNTIFAKTHEQGLIKKGELINQYKLRARGLS
jgi:pilus assembly protein CpaF